jgi:hypothetical protein
MNNTNKTHTPYPYTIRQLESPFRTPAYRYIREKDRLPDLAAFEADPESLCKVRLFLTGSRFAFYVYAIEDISPAPVARPSSRDILLYGVCQSPLGRDCDECGPIRASEILEMRNFMGLPVERDLWFTPISIDEVFQQIERWA